MIDPILSLTFAMHSCKGAYALLIGSGVSRAAQIPTGYEITKDLIRKLAHLRGVKSIKDPESWYKDTFNEYSDYSKLLSSIAKPQAERKQLLRKYFEPDKEEREQRIKIPTAAHKAIARLVASGYIKVIITTNFDRLIETAIEEVGIIPTIISTPDASEGALPLSHSQITIIKPNGDYMDTRIKNTVKELAQYDKRINNLLDRVFDEYGLIVSGWSAEWDTALMAALERCKNHRFTTYWTIRNKPSKVVEKILKLRRAEVITISDSNIFFPDLEAKISALDEYTKPHPLSRKLAIVSLKKYISEPHFKISLYELVQHEVEKLYNEMNDQNFPSQGIIPTKEEIKKRVSHYESLTETLQHLITVGCYWGNDSHHDLWVNCLNRISNPSGDLGGYHIWLNLRLYPALILLYSGGISSITSKNYDCFASLITKPKIRDDIKEYPAIKTLYTWNVMDGSTAKSILESDSSHTIFSDHLYKICREPLKEFLPDEISYQESFDKFEYLYALVHWDLFKKGWAPIGSFAWRNRNYPQSTILHKIAEEISIDKNDWPPLKVDLFGGLLSRFIDCKNPFDSWIKKEFHWD